MAVTNVTLEIVQREYQSLRDTFPKFCGCDTCRSDVLVFALNRIGTPTEENEARAYIVEAGYAVLDGCLPERPAYRKAQNIGRAVTETSFRNLNNTADALIQALIDRVGDTHG